MRLPADEHGLYYDVLLAGTASDAEDGTLTGEWLTNQPGLQPGGEPLLATGNSATVRLYTECFAPAHTVTFRATDSAGISSYATRKITINVLC